MRFLADENFHGPILRGLLRVYPDLDIVRVQDVEINEAEDPIVLEWAAKAGRILLTHDFKTMPKFAYDRVAIELPMPGVIQIPQDMPIGQTIDELLAVIGASDSAEYENRVVYLPL